MWRNRAEDGVSVLDVEDLVGIVGQVADGDVRALDAFFDECHRDLATYLRRRGAEESEGKADEILAEFVRRLPDLNFERSAQIWAYLYRMCRSALSSGSDAGAEVPVGLEVQTTIEGESIAELVETRFLVDDVLGGLTKGQATVLRLRFLRGLSLAETASEVGLSVNAVKALQHRALRSAQRIIMLMAALIASAVVGWAVLHRAASTPPPSDPINERPAPTEEPGPEEDPTSERLVTRDDPQAVESDQSSLGLEAGADLAPPITDFDVRQADGPAPQGDEGILTSAVFADGFETGQQVPVGGFLDFEAGQTIGAWEVVSWVSVDDASHHNPSAVGRYLDLDPDGSVVRVVDGLEPGRAYELVVAAALHDEATEATALVQIGPVAAEIAPTTSARIGFERFVVAFEAPAAATEIRLSGLTSDFPWGGVLIDEVAILPAEVAILPAESNPPPAPNPVLVDGFDDGPQAANGGWVDLGSGDRFGAWTVMNGTVSRDHATHHGRSAADGHYLDLDGSGVVERIVDGLEPGRRYVLTIGASRHSGVTRASARATIGDGSVDVVPTVASTDGIDRFEVHFVASSAQTVLRLAAVEGAPTMGVVIAEVRIDQLGN